MSRAEQAAPFLFAKELDGGDTGFQPPDTESLSNFTRVSLLR